MEDVVTGFEEDSSENSSSRVWSEEEKELLSYIKARPSAFTLVGSRALMPESEVMNSDYDFVCHVDDLSDFIANRAITLDISNYVNVMPLKNSYLLTTYNKNIDVLAYGDTIDVTSIKKAIVYMQNLIPTRFFRVKDCRVRMFEELFLYFREKELT